jgi:hypothetical protein
MQRTAITLFPTLGEHGGGHNFCHGFMDGFSPSVDVTEKTGISGFI